MSGWRYEIERALMRGFLRLMAFFLVAVAGTLIFVTAYVLGPLCLGVTREAIERVSAAWEVRGWFGLGILRVRSRWQYALVGGMLWVWGYLVLRMVITLVNWGGTLPLSEIGLLGLPGWLPILGPAVLFLGGAVVGVLAWQGEDDLLLTW